MSKLGIGSTVKIDETPAAELDVAALQKLGEAHKALREQIARDVLDARRALEA